ncbi:MAG: hypothetical protein H0U49_09720, partial [Parachlamydiaceae bacterium]|nr:hypothetical protein [Parachlamydiaceae bacterium]
MSLSRQTLINSNLAELQPFSTDQAVVEQSHVHSYSHGFEKIYALENIDIRSVRKIDLTSLSKSVTDLE